MDPALSVVQKKLEQDWVFNQRIKLKVQHVMGPLWFCLQDTYFLFLGKYYEKEEEAVMGCILSPIIVNMHMEHLKWVALRT